MKMISRIHAGKPAAVTRLRKVFFVAIIGATFTSFCLPQTFTNPVSAAGGNLGAHETSRSHFEHVLMAPGSTQDFTITFKNTESRSWYKEGANRVAINTTYPLPRYSAFEHSSWSAWWRPAKLPQDEVKPGESATFVFTLHAPSTPGEYIERFSLVGLPEGEIPGGDFGVLITVGEQLPHIPLFHGRVINISENSYEPFTPGQGKTLSITYHNDGRAPWTNPARSTIALETSNPRLRVSELSHRWKTLGHPNYQRDARINPGETVTIYYALMAPEAAGTYNESFQLVAKGLTPILNTEITIPITVIEQQAETPSVQGQKAIEEPDIRVGVTYLNSGVELQPSTHHTYKDTTGNILYSGQAQQVSTVTYTHGTYTLSTAAGTFTTAHPIRVYPDDDGVTSVLNYRTYYDTFRGIIEIHYATSTGRLWVINELPFESYLAGLAEAVNGQHPEYIKSLAVAARSYALWHWYVSSRHASENFTINATTDQLYKGYYYEQKVSDWVHAVDETRGLVMTHPSAGFEKNPLDIALGAYSSGTDGRTRDFTDVFGGKPEDWEWMVPVDDPYGIIADALTRPGNHMVGMSANGALGYAVHEQKTFDWILRHYYSGIDLEVLY